MSGTEPEDPGIAFGGGPPRGAGITLGMRGLSTCRGSLGVPADGARSSEPSGGMACRPHFSSTLYDSAVRAEFSHEIKKNNKSDTPGITVIRRRPR